VKPYQIFVRLEAMESLRSIRGDRLRRLSAYIESLAEDFFQRGDYTERDDTQREIQIKIVGQYALTYWADHAVAEVKITHIGRADSA
jgi:mRNA-degrading endonuclease RelE of RelBE toxin-antitoxin system